MSTTQTQTQVTPERVMQLAWGYAPSIILAAAVHNGLFDELEQGPKTVQEVSAARGLPERGVQRIMNALTGFQFLSKDAEQRYALTPESATFLVTGKPASLAGFIKHIDQDLIPRWIGLSEVVRSGKPAVRANDEEEGSAFFKDFVESLFPMAYPAARVLADTLALAQRAGEVRVLDLAAGSGVWGIVLAQSAPNVRVSAVDWAGVLPVTRKMADRCGVGDRLECIPGDLLEADFGKGFQVAMLGQILHSEGEERSRAILRKVFDALAPGGTLAIAEFLVNEDRTGPPMGLLFAVNMLVATERGDAFSFEQIASWLREVGFESPRTLEAPGPSPLILATKP